MNKYLSLIIDRHSTANSSLVKSSLSGHNSLGRTNNRLRTTCKPKNLGRSTNETVPEKKGAKKQLSSKMFDHGELLHSNKALRIKQISVFGSNFIEAIHTTFEDIRTGQEIRTLAKGRKFNANS